MDIQILHKYLEDELNKAVIENIIIEKCFVEEGAFVLIGDRNLDNYYDKTNDKIIGIVPVSSNSIYTPNETFKIEDFTNNYEHFIHNILIIKRKPRKPIIVCDPQGGIYVYTFTSQIKNIMFLIKEKEKFILEEYCIDYESFYKCAKSDGCNDIYSQLIEEDKVNEFIIDLLNDKIKLHTK